MHWTFDSAATGLQRNADGDTDRGVGIQPWIPADRTTKRTSENHDSEELPREGKYHG